MNDTLTAEHSGTTNVTPAASTCGPAADAAGLCRSDLRLSRPAVLSASLQPLCQWRLTRVYDSARVVQSLIVLTAAAATYGGPEHDQEVSSGRVRTSGDEGKKMVMWIY